ncbi:MepB family protein [Candidatus Babela massiliensis]|uniref:Uncharacterized protein conserved in bacteria n=1 Tax=Candidatus Babela massiliensis TaxID=673862 RepID=V6DHA5_9BACT|nr:MepB family protein [Candidatus Babela massiliensis]CDK30924.1 Uncharacterized protein conserved in bacteria [Candidatus Babela massiliensis]
MNKNLKNIYYDLFFVCTLYERNGLACKNIVHNEESKEYSASKFTINDFWIEFRTAKITPKKVGQFVTFWKRIGDSTILPYDISDKFDFFIVSVRKGNYLGQFIFPKNILYQEGFLSVKGEGGKRAMRVYPPWDEANSKQAKKTQTWQLKYFVDIFPEANIMKMNSIFS